MPVLSKGLASLVSIRCCKRLTLKLCCKEGPNKAGSPLCWFPSVEVKVAGPLCGFLLEKLKLGIYSAPGKTSPNKKATTKGSIWFTFQFFSGPSSLFFPWPKQNNNSHKATNSLKLPVKVANIYKWNIGGGWPGNSKQFMPLWLLGS